MNQHDETDANGRTGTSRRAVLSERDRFHAELLAFIR